MLSLAGQFFEALLVPALAGGLISWLLTLAMPRKQARPAVAAEQRAPRARVSRPVRPRPATCMAVTRHPLDRGGRQLAAATCRPTVPSGRRR